MLPYWLITEVFNLSKGSDVFKKLRWNTESVQECFDIHCENNDQNGISKCFVESLSEHVKQEAHILRVSLTLFPAAVVQKSSKYITNMQNSLTLPFLVTMLMIWLYT